MVTSRWCHRGRRRTRDNDGSYSIAKGLPPQYNTVVGAVSSRYFVSPNFWISDAVSIDMWEKMRNKNVGRGVKLSRSFLTGSSQLSTAATTDTPSLLFFGTTPSVDKIQSSTPFLGAQSPTRYSCGDYALLHFRIRALTLRNWRQPPMRSVGVQDTSFSQLRDRQLYSFVDKRPPNV
ncbi:hypothetical protein PM082_010038 [Marasmius tenuissimus]|nr:hypothetical protein PM082_010038 [Marasmius tenuissimus]